LTQAFLKTESKSGWHWHFGSGICISICCLFIERFTKEKLVTHGPKISVTGWQIFVTGWHKCHPVVALKDVLVAMQWPR